MNKKFFKKFKNLLFRPMPNIKIIIDTEKKLGKFEKKPSIKTNYNKEEISRKYVLEHEGGGNLNFLDVGARDGALTYLLGIKGKLIFDNEYYKSNKKIFDKKFIYYGMDLEPVNADRVIIGDACSTDYVERNINYKNFFDVIYSNNVFEHFEKPWLAADNLTQLLKIGGIVITIVPFSQRYHEAPKDYFRYTHKGIESLFLFSGKFEILESGYDILGRRINWQGSGHANDVVPIDKFGAWRETWYVVSVMRKIA